MTRMKEQFSHVTCISSLIDRQQTTAHCQNVKRWRPSGWQAGWGDGVSQFKRRKCATCEVPKKKPPSQTDLWILRWQEAHHWALGLCCFLSVRPQLRWTPFSLFLSLSRSHSHTHYHSGNFSKPFPPHHTHPDNSNSLKVCTSTSCSVCLKQSTSNNGLKNSVIGFMPLLH